MDPRIGQPVIRDRWGEPIPPKLPDPGPSKPKRKRWRFLSWVWRRILILSGKMR